MCLIPCPSLFFACLWTESPAKLFLCQKNRWANLVKHFHGLTLARSLVVSVGYDCFRLMQFLRQGQLAEAGAIVRGGRSFLNLLPQPCPRDGKTSGIGTTPIDGSGTGAAAFLSESLAELKRLRALKGTLFSALQHGLPPSRTIVGLRQRSREIHVLG